PAYHREPAAPTKILPLRTSPRLAGEAEGWLRQGYSLVYADNYLVQLARKGLPPRRLAVLGGLLGMAVVSTAVGLTLLALRSRSWHIVSLTRTPHDTVLMHDQWSDEAPSR
ncbi:MAG TPA: hypothetical protein VF807_02050, partial [Ktedonobacterales bacterium]